MLEIFYTWSAQAAQTPASKQITPREQHYQGWPTKEYIRKQEKPATLFQKD